MSKEYKCQIKHCRNEGSLFYYKIPICDKCWEKYATKEVVALKKALGVKEK